MGDDDYAGRIIRPTANPDAPAIDEAALRTVDTLDDRREIVVQLGKLDLEQRLDFLLWAKDRVNRAAQLTGGNLIAVNVQTGTVEEAFADLCTLVASFGLDVVAVVAELERRAGRAARDRRERDRRREARREGGRERNRGPA